MDESDTESAFIWARGRAQRNVNQFISRPPFLRLQAAAEGALGLPPPLNHTQADADLLRLSIILAALCKAAYTATVEDVGRVSAISLPPPPGGDAPTTAAATLLHFREAHAPPGVTGDAAAGGPQQYGVWRVKGVGLVVAFRGTATRHDALVDAALAPARLGVAAGAAAADAGADDDGSSLFAHHGFLTGARRHAADIGRLVARFNGRVGGEVGDSSTPPSTRGPVWLTGHSLGGAYAAALALDLLAARDGSAARFFGGGGLTGTGGAHAAALAGGVITFGAPLVLVGPPLLPQAHQARQAGGGRPAAAQRAPSPRQHALRATHARLAACEGAHLCALREAGVPKPRRLTLVAFVNGADLVPRALGSPLGGITAALGSAVPLLAPARALATRYRPFGACLLIVGSTVRVTGASPPAGGGVGTLATAEDVAAHLHAGRAWTAVAAGSAAVKAENAHDLSSYRAGLAAHARALAVAAAGGVPPRRRRRVEGGGGDGTVTPPDALAVAVETAADLGRALGDASAAAAVRLRAAAARTAASTWRAATVAAVVAVSTRFGSSSSTSGVVAELVEEAAAPAPQAAPDRKRRWLGRKGGGA